MLDDMHTAWGRRRLALRDLLVSGVLAGMAGTAAMATTARLNRVRYARSRGIATSEIDEILDYDDSEYVVAAAGTLLRGVAGRAPATAQGRQALFLAVHWGYGSAVGAGHAALYRLVGREPAAGAVFFVGCQAMALGLFPVLGGTPVPWRWSRTLMSTNLVQHVVYASVTAATAAALRRPSRGSVTTTGVHQDRDRGRSL